MIRVIAVARRRLGANSTLSVQSRGIAPPSARPATKRSAIRVARLFARASAKVSTLKQAVAAMIAGRRPKRSARTPKSTPPTSVPNNPALNATPKPVLLTWNAVSIGLVAKAMTCMS